MPAADLRIESAVPADAERLADINHAALTPYHAVSIDLILQRDRCTIWKYMLMCLVSLMPPAL
jgi:hypothetical protein